MKIGKLHIHWGCNCRNYASIHNKALEEAYRKIGELEMELMHPRSLTAAHDREVILKYLDDQGRDELESLSLGFDHKWRPLK